MALYYSIFGWLIIPAIIVLIIAYVKSKKFYPLMYVLSIVAYVNFVFYVIDSFNFGKGGVTLMFAISAVLLIILGVFFSKIRKSQSYN
ncbi:MAG: hypothetical protein NT076_04660 [Candidatus Pacearchaeota archaeon]|nr:hypothetical protein [Candidatus Pacearchaeota archaeon]